MLFLLKKFYSMRSQPGVAMIRSTLTATVNRFIPTNAIQSQKGVTMIEYALIAALVAVALIVILGTLSGSLEGIFQSVSDALDGAGGDEGGEEGGEE